MALGHEEKSPPTDPDLVPFAIDRLNYMYQVLIDRGLLDENGIVKKPTLRISGTDYEVIYTEDTVEVKRGNSKSTRKLTIKRSCAFLGAFRYPHKGISDTIQLEIRYDPGPPKTEATVWYSQDNPDKHTRFSPKRKKEFDIIKKFLFSVEKDLKLAADQGII